ncbi:MAG: MMPL family transporter [Candidatus Coatesbacteria bacterium]|nr:MMPL family transporter [Candidatus Coatesbacteria bacterium]
MFENLLGRIATLCRNRSLTIILVSFVLLVVAVVLALRLQFSTDVRQLLPKSDPRVETFFDAMSRFAGSETLIGVVTWQGQKDDRLVQEFVKHFGESVEKSDLIDGVDFNANQLALLFFREIFLKHIFLFLDEADFQEVLGLLSEDGMEKALRQARAVLISQAGLVQKEFIAHDPLNLRRFMFKYSPRLKEGIKLDLVDGYYFSKDHSICFILLNPKEDAQNVEFDRELIAFLNRTAEETLVWLDELHEWEKGRAAKALTISFTGSHAILLEESSAIKKDLFMTIIVSFALVIILFAVSFGRVGIAFYVGIPLISALAFTLALCYLTLGYVNILTIILVVCIMGLGIDFALHLYSRYADERASGRTGDDALHLSYVRTGVGTLACAATTSVAFLSCALSRFQGIRELGILAAAGILICLFVTLLFMGALLKQKERLSRRAYRAPRISLFGLTKVADLVMRHPTAVIVVWSLLTLLAALRMTEVKFSEDISSLRAKTSKAARLQKRIGEEVGGGFKDWIAFRTLPNASSALEFSERMRVKCDQMLGEGELGSTSSLLDFLPSLSRQRENLKRLGGLSGRISMDEVVSRFEAALADSGMRMTDEYVRYIRQLASSLQNEKVIDFGSLFKEPALRRLLGKYVERDKDGTGYSAAIYLSPKRMLSEKRDVLEFSQQLRKQFGDEVSITSTTYLTAFLKDTIVGDIWIIACVAAVSVLIILLMQFKGSPIALLAMVPLCSGSVLMLATASMLEIDLNPVNLFVVPMILGIGIDDGIHLAHRFLERKSTACEAIVGTGKALVLTSLTTILAFGTLIFAGFEGLVQVGIFTILGVGFALLASLTFLPALLIKYSGGKNGS